jgi:hypothetical protein
LVALPFAEVEPKGCLGLEVDVDVEIGAEVVGPDGVFATTLAEVMVVGSDLRSARAAAAAVLRDPPEVVPTDSIGGAGATPSK